MKKSSCIQDDECLPLKTLHETLNWEPNHVRHVTAELQLRTKVHDKPKTLLCHDMKGGYLDDRFVHGTKTTDNFSFVHWAHVDTFVYFSHWLVTIPPCSWINAAHRNGTIILGTFITEWDEGSNACQAFLSSKQSVIELCDQLVKIAVFHGFDGWLINIENKIKPDQVKHLEDFVRILSSKMHDACSYSQVIWYDSVIDSGELKWQNSLNEYNRNFFNACNGIFLNYNWKDKDLAQSVLLAENRIHDVYVGVDCFGRGCFGGGGLCTNVAVEAARKEGLSVAIFAFGWVYECLESGDFLENQHSFWGLLASMLPVRPIDTLPLITSFCPGFGTSMYRNGEVISSEPWFNLALQQPQPDYFQNSSDGGTLKMCTDQAFNGGGCLLLESFEKSDSLPTSFGILTFHVVLKETVVISFVYKPLSSMDTQISLKLQMSAFGRMYHVILTTGEKISCNKDHDRVIEPASDSDLQSFAFVPVRVKNDWTTRSYILRSEEFKYHVIETIDVLVSDIQAKVLLGQLEIVPVKPKSRFWCSLVDISDNMDNDNISVKCKLEWICDRFVDMWDLFYEFDGQQEVYISTTSQLFYDVNLKFSRTSVNSEKKLTFILYSCENSKNSGSKLCCCIDLQKGK